MRSFHAASAQPRLGNRTRLLFANRAASGGSIENVCHSGDIENECHSGEPLL